MGAVLEFIGRYRIAFVSCILLVILTSVGVFFWERSKEKALMENSDLIYRVLRYGDDASMKNLAANVGKGAVSSVARLKLAVHELKNNNITSARKIYDDIAGDRSAPPELRELAEYMSAVLLFDDDTSEKLEDALVKLAVSKTGIYRSAAKEALVALKLKEGDTEAAVWVMKEILEDPSSVPYVRRNIQSLLKVYGRR